MRTNISTNEKEWIYLLKKTNKTKDEIIRKDLLLDLITNELYKESKEFIEELNSIGFKLKSVYDLVNTRKPYPELVPILLKYLNSNLHKRTIEGIVRALTVKEARGIGLPSKLLDLYEEVPLETEYEGFRWAITNAIWFTVLKKDKEIAPRIKKIIENEEDKINKKRLLDTLKKLGV